MRITCANEFRARFDAFHVPKFREPIEKQSVPAAYVQDALPTRCRSQTA
jgi:hypothetical protein